MTVWKRKIKHILGFNFLGQKQLYNLIHFRRGKIAHRLSANLGGRVKEWIMWWPVQVFKADSMFQ